MLPLLLRLLSIQACSLETLCAQTHVHLVLCVRAMTEDFVHEATGMALIKGGDHVGAIWEHLSVVASMDLEMKVYFSGFQRCGDADAL
jgi:hypothetical protein